MKLILLSLLMLTTSALAQFPPIEPGVSQDLAKWRSVQYSNISYKLDLTLEKMSPVLRGHMEIRVTQAASACAEPNCPPLAIILDWRKLPGHEKDSTVSNVNLNGKAITIVSVPPPIAAMSVPPAIAGGSTSSTAMPGTSGSISSTGRVQPPATAGGTDYNDHLVFHDGVRMGENVITLDFTSPILTSGSAITRYIDKEDGSEYIYSLFVPSDASTAFPVFDQPDLKARFDLDLTVPSDWRVVSNTADVTIPLNGHKTHCQADCFSTQHGFQITKPISTYVFAFAAGPWTRVSVPPAVAGGLMSSTTTTPRDPSLNVGCLQPPATAGGTDSLATCIYVRKSQAAKFQQHAAETFRLTRAAITYLETYFDYKFPWPKYDLVLIPEFPFGGMEHAGATFLKESSVIFPTEPTKGDYISRANLIFHETAHQWFGDLVTMRWFDDLWLKEGFAEFMAYKTLEHVMPDANAWKVFYERNKQAAYATDSTRGTTPIYQPIGNLSAAKSAYGNIVYRKAPSFLRQAEAYLGEKEFQTGIRAFLKKYAFKNAEWKDLVNELQKPYGRRGLPEWAEYWITRPGVPTIRFHFGEAHTEVSLGQGMTGAWMLPSLDYSQTHRDGTESNWGMAVKVLLRYGADTETLDDAHLYAYSTYVDYLPRSYDKKTHRKLDKYPLPDLIFGNYRDYGYGIFLLDDKSRDYVLKHIGEEKDPFLRSMMWGALWDSVREAELDPREYVELVIRQLGGGTLQKPARRKGTISGDPTLENDETIASSLLGRVSTALNYYIAEDAPAPVRASSTSDLRSRLEAVLLDRMQHAETAGQRVTFFRAFVSNASTEHGRTVLKAMLAQSANSPKNHPVAEAATPLLRKEGSPEKTQAGSLRSDAVPTLRTKDRFDIVTRLIALGDRDAPKLLADLEKTETSDDAKRYAYAAHAAFATAENRAKFWNDFVSNKDISESWVEAGIGPFNSIRYPELSQPYLERALRELPNLKRTRKIFFVNNWLAAWLGGQRDETALAIVNKFLADNPQLDNDLRLKVLENVDLIERAVKIRKKFGGS